MYIPHIDTLYRFTRAGGQPQGETESELMGNGGVEAVAKLKMGRGNSPSVTLYCISPLGVRSCMNIWSQPLIHTWLSS